MKIFYVALELPKNKSDCLFSRVGVRLHRPPEGGRKKQKENEKTAGKNDNNLLTKEIIVGSKWWLHYSPLRHKRKIDFQADGSIGKGKSIVGNLLNRGCLQLSQNLGNQMLFLRMRLLEMMECGIWQVELTQLRKGDGFCLGSAAAVIFCFER